MAVGGALPAGSGGAGAGADDAVGLDEPAVTGMVVYAEDGGRVSGSGGFGGAAVGAARPPVQT